MWFKALSLLLLTLAPNVMKTQALGINCRGSSQCRTVTTGHQDFMSDFNRTLSTLEFTYFNQTYYDISILRFYKKRHIICRHTRPGRLCLFPQGNIPSRGVNGTEVLTNLRYLINHGCRLCGSAPFSRDNNVDTQGMLTLNYVYSADSSNPEYCSGYCNRGVGPYHSEEIMIAGYE